ncbi:MAG: sigma-70 family RNA polymerase sigma factor [Phycisphaerae bacterium]|nr:sigma-70 family RNA polymerase sigma factor [Saprospiraceae bacterium]
MTHTDAQLIGTIQQGGPPQEQAIRHLYEQCFYMVRDGRGKYRQLDDEDLLTAYNSAIIAVRKQILNNAFRGESALATYLQKIFSNRCIDILRTKSSNRTVPMEHIPDAPDESQDLLSRWVREEQLEMVREKLKHLGGVCEKILHLSEYLDYTAQQIAEAIGFSNANSVNSKKYSCLQKLRELMTAAS